MYVTNETQDSECRSSEDPINRNGNTARGQHCAAFDIPCVDELPRAQWQIGSRTEQVVEEQCFHKYLHHDRSFVGCHKLDRAILKSLVSPVRHAPAMAYLCRR
jgi:hypothetical protein